MQGNKKELFQIKSWWKKIGNKKPIDNRNTIFGEMEKNNMLGCKCQIWHLFCVKYFSFTYFSKTAGKEGLWKIMNVYRYVYVIECLYIENCTIFIPKGNSYCRRKSSARGPRFKVSSEGLSAEIDIQLRSPIQVQAKANVA